MTSQFAKDPQEVLDYPWPVPLDTGDAVATFVAVRLSGDVVLDSYSESGGIGTIWLSGGTDGTASVFTLTATTTSGRTFETTIIISVVEASSALIAEFLMRYPAFASVSISTIAYWLTDAEVTVTDSWITADISPARMALAAHNMAMLGLDRPTNDAVGSLAQMGVTGFRSASMSVNLDAETIRNANSGGYSSTKYGQQFLPYLRRNVGGPRLVGCHA